MQKIKPIKRLLGFDFGTKNIGVATGQALTKTATPLTILKAKDGIPDWNKIETLIQDWLPDAIVVGIPYNMNNSESEMSLRARKFGNRIKGRFNLPFFEIDERLSSFEIRQAHKENQNTSKNEHLLIDSLVAKRLLESWMSDPDNQSILITPDI